MAKLLLGVGSALYLLSTTSFAAEKTVTLAVENMTCAVCPHIVKGSLAAEPSGDLFRGQDRDGHL